jgi:hypothetical protein
MIVWGEPDRGGDPQVPLHHGVRLVSSLPDGWEAPRNLAAG